jgi:hypothetical protein
MEDICRASCMEMILRLDNLEQRIGSDDERLRVELAGLHLARCQLRDLTATATEIEAVLAEVDSHVNSKLRALEESTVNPNSGGIIVETYRERLLIAVEADSAGLDHGFPPGLAQISCNAAQQAFRQLKKHITEAMALIETTMQHTDKELNTFVEMAVRQRQHFISSDKIDENLRNISCACADAHARVIDIVTTEASHMEADATMRLRQCISSTEALENRLANGQGSYIGMSDTRSAIVYQPSRTQLQRETLLSRSGKTPLQAARDFATRLQDDRVHTRVAALQLHQRPVSNHVTRLQSARAIATAEQERRADERAQALSEAAALRRRNRK